MNQKITFQEKTYQISFEAMDENLKKQLSETALKRFIELLEKCQLNPRPIYQEVKDFCHEHTHVPEVTNLLTFAHIQNRQIAEAEKLIEKTYLDHPDYLFSKINYADQCIRKKKLDQVAEIFQTFDLSELYPEKEVFHTSEFRGFMIMMAYYHLAKKEREEALIYYRTAKEIEPHHISVIHLEKKLFKRTLLSKLLAKLSSSSRR